VRIAYAGTPEFAVPALLGLISSQHSVVGVLTQPDRPKGRGRQLAASPVKQTAQAHGIPVAQPQSLKSEAERAELVSWRPDVLVVVAYGLILPRAVLDLPRLGCLNIHASLLPRWRGAAPIQRAVLAGDRDTGVTIMRMDVGLDTGPILLQERLTIRDGETAGSLHDRLAELGTQPLLKVLEGLENKTLRETPQPAEGVTYAAKIDKAEAVIDWSRSAAEIERKVHAFNPWPIAETVLGGEQLRIYAACAVEAGADEAAIRPASTDATQPASSAPGTILTVDGDSIVVACGRGALALTVVQRPGGKPVTARDFANTRHDLARQQLG
jgi:methionyl-tRNA formyltransferase